MERIESILNLWFEGLNDDSQTIDSKSPAVRKWFLKNEAFDDTLRVNFQYDLDKAKEGKFSHWEEVPRGRMALILLFDQFSRNIYRGTPRMYETDERALLLSERSVKDGSDHQLSCIERVFLYMPYMHAEDKGRQAAGVDCFRRLVDDARRICPQNVDYFLYNLKYMNDHKKIIDRFGRFPHRNAILGRESTPEETEFLKQKGSGF